MFILAYIFLLVFLQPCENRVYCKLDVFFLICIIAFITADWSLHDYDHHLVMSVDRIVFIFLIPVTLISPVCLVFYYIHRRSQRVQAVTEIIRRLFTRHRDRDLFLLLHRVMDI